MTSNTARKIATNTIGQIGLRGVDIVLGVFTLALITRYLGQEGFGYYITITAFLQFAIIIVDLGLYLTLLREISAETEDRISFITNNIFTLRLVTAVLFLSFAAIVVFFTPYPDAVKYGVVYLAFAFIFSALISTLTALFQKYLQMIRVAAILSLIRIIMLVSSIAVIQADKGLHGLVIVQSIASAIGFVVMWYLLTRLPQPVHLRLILNLQYIQTVLKKTWPLAVSTLLNLIYLKADTIILSLYRPAEEVGLYGASYRVIEILTTFPHMFMGLVMPMLTAAWIAKKYSHLQLVWEKTFIFFSFIAFPIMAGAMVVGEKLMILLSGEEFAISGNILRILIVAAGSIFFATLFTYMVLVIDKQRKMIKYFGLTAFFALVGYFIFIPIYSYWGAAVITVLGEFIIIFSAAHIVRREYRLRIPWAIVAKLFISSITMAAITYTLMPYLPLIPLIAVSAVLYLLLTIITKAISLDDLRILRQT